jgi:hypothetical protein
MEEERCVLLHALKLYQQRNLWQFLQLLFDIGPSAADAWVNTHFDDIGERSALDLRALFQG